MPSSYLIRALLIQKVIVYLNKVYLYGREMEMVQAVLPYLQTFLAFANICVIGYGFYKFLNKPHNMLESKVNEHDVKIKEIETSLKQGNDRFRKQEDTNEVMQICMLALIDFELSYCSHTNYTYTEDLIKAKNILREHLASK